MGASRDVLDCAVADGSFNLSAFSHLLFLLAEFLSAPFDAIFGRNRRSYTVSIDVEAPKALTWAVASSHSIRLEGTPPIEIRAEPDPDRPGVYSGHLHIGQINLPMTYRVLDERRARPCCSKLSKRNPHPNAAPETITCARSP